MPAKQRYYPDDDPPPRREQPAGEMKLVTWGLTTAARRIQLSFASVTWSTRAQRQRHRRNVVVVLCHKAGLPTAYIAEVFDLARSRVSEIIEEMEAAMGEQTRWD